MNHRQRRGGVEDTTYLLEVNLISAQGLKYPASKLRRLRTYAIVWVDPAAKLRTQIDRVGGDQPTWNDKFFFRVTPEFLQSETSGVTAEIYAVGVLKDSLIGSVRFLVSTFLPVGFSLDSVSQDVQTPCVDIPVFNAFQIRRPSGCFHGVLNVGVMIVTRSEFAGLNLTGVSAIGYRDLMGKNSFRTKKTTGNARGLDGQRLGKKKSDGNLSAADSCSESCADSPDFSDGVASTASGASSSTGSRAALSPARPDSPRVLKDFNGRVVSTGTKDGGGILCRLGFEKKVHIRSSDENIRR